MHDYFIQGIGFLGLTCFIVSYQLKTNRLLFFCQMVGCILFCVQMCLLGAFTGAMGLIVNILRNLLLLQRSRWTWVNQKYTLAAILLLLTFTTAYTWTGWISLLPLLSVGITTIGYWTDNALKIRISQLFGSPCTLLYDLLIHSWGGAASEAMTLVSILVSIHRFGWKSMNENQTGL